MAKGKGFYRKPNGSVVFQVYDPVTKTQRKLSRDEIAHLDSATDEQIATFRQLYIAKNRAQAKKTLKTVLAQTDEAQFLFEQFLAEYQSLRKTSDTTTSDEKGRWTGYITPYFVKEHATKDVRLWYLHTAGFPPWLIGSPLGINQQKKVIGLLERFGLYLARHRKIPEPWGFIKPTENTSKETPLEFEVLPQEVLDWSASREPRTAMLALLGYFASMRPEESFALKKSDILTSDDARNKAKTHLRFKQHGLGSGVSIDVKLAFKKTGKIGRPKSEVSRAVVNVFSPEAARRIAALLRLLPDGWLFPRRRRIRKNTYEYLYDDEKPMGRGTMFNYWEEHGFRKSRALEEPKRLVSLHDLRRASCLYLGRTLDLPTTLVQEHLRHADIKTTLLYMRQPGVVVAPKPNQNWDDVG